MATTPEYTEHVFAQLALSGSFTSRKMFGGVGIYIEEVFCAIIGSSDRFYLRVGPDNLKDFEREGMSKFSGGKGAGMPYYEVPEYVLEDPGILRSWTRKARDAALQAKIK